MAMAICKQKLKCTACKHTITTREFLKCIQCDKVFDVNCTRDISEKRFRLMTPIRKQVLMKSWKCHVCVAKIENIVGKIKVATKINVNQKQNITPINQSTPRSSPNVFYSSESTPSAGNIAEHNNYVVNVPTENSFASLNSDTDDEIPEVDEGFSLLQKTTLNRSCPDLSRADSDNIKEMKMKLDNLMDKLETTNKMYNDLLLENGSLHKRITEYEQKIDKLTRICKLAPKQKPSKKERKSINTVDYNIHETNLKELSFKQSEPEPELNEEIEMINETQENELEIVNYNKKMPIAGKKKIIILADQMGRKIRQTLQTLVGSQFDVHCFCKPGAKLSEILKSYASDIRNLNDDDFVIIMGGMNDDNPFSIISSMTIWLNKFTKPNVILCEVPFNKHLNETKLNYEFKLLCSKHYNATFLNMDFSRYIPNRKQFSLIVSRCLLRDILHIGYRTNYNNFINRQRHIKFVTASTQTEPSLKLMDNIVVNKIDLKTDNFFRS